MRVRNLNGTSKNPDCPCGTWEKHWENYTGKRFAICSEIECRKGADDGSHVQKVNSSDKSWYIIPLCKTHNGLHGQEIDILDNTILVPVTGRNKCGS